MSAIFSKRTIIIIIILAAIIAVGYWILPVSVPIITAFITALLLEPAVGMFQNKFKIKRNLSVLVVFTLFILLISTSSYFLLTKVITEVIKFGENLPGYINGINQIWFKVEENLNTAIKDLPKEVVEEISKQVQQLITNMRNDLTNLLDVGTIKDIATKVVTEIPKYLVSILVYLIALFLFLVDMPRLKTRLYAHLTTKTADKVSFMATRLSFVVFGFAKAQFLVSIIIFIVSFVGLLIIKPDVALVMSLIIWVIDFIPLIGSIVILSPWSLYHLLTGDLVLGGQLAVLAVILLIIRRTVEPKVMGRHIGLSPLSTLISMYLGMKLLGLFGFIIGPLLLIAFNSAREAGIIKLDFKI